MHLRVLSRPDSGAESGGAGRSGGIQPKALLAWGGKAGRLDHESRRANEPLFRLPRRGPHGLPPGRKSRGFVFQSSEIYGGLGSVWDYGPLGVELKQNVKERWWRAMVHARDDIEGLDAAILMHPRVWEASGHVAGFTDPLVDCRHCKNRFRADDPRIKGTPGQPDAQCPVCGTRGSLTEPRMFNLMFKTFMGPVEEQAAIVYLRPETAQGIYVNYLNVLQ